MVAWKKILLSFPFAVDCKPKTGDVFVAFRLRPAVPIFATGFVPIVKIASFIPTAGLQILNFYTQKFCICQIWYIPPHLALTHIPYTICCPYAYTTSCTYACTTCTLTHIGTTSCTYAGLLLQGHTSVHDDVIFFSGFWIRRRIFMEWTQLVAIFADHELRFASQLFDFECAVPLVDPHVLSFYKICPNFIENWRLISPANFLQY